MLLSRIEDQCLERFDKQYPNSLFDSVALSQDELRRVLLSWLEFWHAERPVMKSRNIAQQLKQHVCECRIFLILTIAEENGLLDEIPNDLRAPRVY